MDTMIKKSHNVSNLFYHLVCPVKYRNAVFNEIKGVDKEIVKVCAEIEKRYSIHFIEIGIDRDHVHFLIQSVPQISPSRIAQIVKSITARELFRRRPEIQLMLWGGEFWTKGYYVDTIGHAGGKEMIQQYIQNQNANYEQIHFNQPKLL